MIHHRKNIYLAPSFDHAASMGQNETDETRRERLTTRDKGRHISAYVTKARSAIYDTKTSPKPLLTLELFVKAAQKSPQAAQVWLDRLREIPENACNSFFEQLPSGEISSLAQKFALTMLELNKQRLLETMQP